MLSGKVRTGENIGDGWIDTTAGSIERAKARLVELNELLTEAGSATVVKPEHIQSTELLHSSCHGVSTNPGTKHRRALANVCFGSDTGWYRLQGIPQENAIATQIPWNERATAKL
jgi:hypothetical protein